MDKDVEGFCVYLAKVYVRLLKLGVPHPYVNCWMAQSITLFYTQRNVDINAQFKNIIDGLEKNGDQKAS